MSRAQRAAAGGLPGGPGAERGAGRLAVPGRRDSSTPRQAGAPQLGDLRPTRPRAGGRARLVAGQPLRRRAGPAAGSTACTTRRSACWARGLVVEARSVPDGVVEAVRYAPDGEPGPVPSPSGCSGTPSSWARRRAGPIQLDPMLLDSFLAPCRPIVRAAVDDAGAHEQDEGHAMKIDQPRHREAIAELPEDSAGRRRREGDQARARPSPPGRARRFAERLATIRRFKDALAANKDELARTLTREMGKPIKQAAQRDRRHGRAARLLPAATPRRCWTRRWCCREGEAAGPAGGDHRHEPLGVVANISAWNYPYFVGSNVFVPGAADRQHRALQAVRARHPDGAAHRARCCTRRACPPTRSSR